MKLLLVDDHPLYGVGFGHALGLAEPGLQVLIASSLDHGLALATAHPDIDIVLLDYHLGELSGIAGLRSFGRQHPLVPRVLISGNDTPSLVAAARAAGASGFLSKSQTAAAMLAALHQVAAGGLAFGAVPHSALPLVAADAAAAPKPTLRQLEVLSLLARGQPNKRIASAMGIAERTVKLHVTALLAQLGARNRTQLLVLARERGLV